MGWLLFMGGRESVEGAAKKDMLLLLHASIGALQAAPSRTPAPGLLERLENPRLARTEDAQRTRVVRLPRFLTDDEISHLNAVAALLRDEVGEVQRSNGLEEGSWRTVFFNHRLRERVPWLHEKLLHAALAVDADHWGLIDAQREPLAIRVAEHHTILRSGGLPINNHHDYGSLITMDILLCDTSEFEGGTFATMEPGGDLLPQTFERGDLLLFQSHKFHCVSPVTSGRRQVFVCELWEGLERRCPGRCQTPWGPCYCKLNAVYRRGRLPDCHEAMVDLATLN